MGDIGIISANRELRVLENYSQVLEQLGGDYVYIDTLGSRAEIIASNITGLLIMDGTEISDSPPNYLEALAIQDEITIINQCLNNNLPILAIGRGFHILNLALGGNHPVLIAENHDNSHKDSEATEVYHQIFVSPGAKTSATIGAAGFFRVNSCHKYGIYDKQRSPNLMAMAYAVEDGLIEILESPEHDWVIATQFNLENLTEVPKLFYNLFLALLERSQT
jgi:gamma-glutamyl-gamma-aminobutyrate hydrolase PuuD